MKGLVSSLLVVLVISLVEVSHAGDVWGSFVIVAVTPVIKMQADLLVLCLEDKILKSALSRLERRIRALCCSNIERELREKKVPWR